MPQWSSSDPAVLRVGGDGRAQAIGAGECTLEVTFKGLRASRTIRVEP
jgi:hypothetical protein